MRKIKFRAWDKKNQRWYKPTHEAYKNNLFELLVSFNGDLLSHTMQGINHESIFPDRFELMQHTGLQDKNGKEIYEGDIYEVGDLLYRVKFINGAFCGGILYYNDNDFSPLGFKCDRSEEDIILDNDTTFINVIGNIYENPELLDRVEEVEEIPVMEGTREALDKIVI